MALHGNPIASYSRLARRALTPAHDPALGLDASVRLGDVVAALERVDDAWDGPTLTGPASCAALLIEMHKEGRL